jgi:YHS domain-containing protein
METRFHLLIISLMLISCSHRQAKVSTTEKKDSTTGVPALFARDMVANENDFSCGMSLKMGIGDTVHYKDKVYGFCSKTCKDIFLKNPEAELAKSKK